MKKLAVLMFLVTSISISAETHVYFGTNLGALIQGGFNVAAELLFGGISLSGGFGSKSIQDSGYTVSVTVISVGTAYYFEQYKGFNIGLSVGSCNASVGSLSVSGSSFGVGLGYRFLLGDNAYNNSGFAIDIGGGLASINLAGYTASSPSLSFAVGYQI